MSRHTGPIRNTYQWRKLRARVFTEEVDCWLCGRYVDQTIPVGRWSRSADHVIPIDKGGDPLDRANCRLAHFGCNSRRGARAPLIEASGATHHW